MTGEFPARRASNAENVSNWRRHHVQSRCTVVLSWFTMAEVHLIRQGDCLTPGLYGCDSNATWRLPQCGSRYWGGGYESSVGWFLREISVLAKNLVMTEYQETSGSIPWPLMHWYLSSPGHLQIWNLTMKSEYILVFHPITVSGYDRKCIFILSFLTYIYKNKNIAFCYH